jgi:D-glycero-alpha-D-manno-heptose-7-phosphate kinase
MPMILPAARLAELEAHLMLFYTGIVRTAADVARSYVENLGARRRQLRIMKDLVGEATDVLASSKEIEVFGHLLHEAWLVKQSLSAKISPPEVNTLYDRARAAGAVGGKLTGAGGGGFLLLFVPPDKHTSVLQALERQIHVPFRFEAQGSQIIFHELGVDYAEAEKSRRQRPPTEFRELSVVA